MCPGDTSIKSGRGPASHSPASASPQRGAPVHVVLLVYASTVEKVDRFAEQYRTKAQSAGFTCVKVLEGTTLHGRKEHFGFRDGIAQPVVRGSGRAERPGNTLNPGEFLLGHEDGYGNTSFSRFLETSISAITAPISFFASSPGMWKLFGNSATRRQKTVPRRRPPRWSAGGRAGRLW